METCSVFSFSIANMFVVTVVVLASCLFIFEMVLNSRLFKLSHFIHWIFVVPSWIFPESQAIWSRYDIAVHSRFSFHVLDIFALFIGKIGYRSIWSIVKPFIPFEMAQCTPLNCKKISFCCWQIHKNHRFSMDSEYISWIWKPLHQ